jgi:hypothetical protein
MGLREYLADLEEQERRLEALIQEIRIAKAHARKTLERRAPPSRPPAIEAAPAVQADKPEESAKVGGFGPYAGMGNEEAALAYLRKVGRPAKTSDISNALQRGGIGSEAKNFQAAMFGALRRLVEKGAIRKVGEGRRMHWEAVPAIPAVP